MKIYFLQLPLSDRGNNYTPGNAPYGAASISLYLKGFFPGACQTEIMDPLYANTLSDKSTAAFVASAKPDIVSFSVFLWNAERSLRVAEYISRLTGAVIVFGGPEVAPGSVLFAGERTHVDYFVSGEGEWFFEKYIQNSVLTPYISEINGNKLVVQPHEEMIPSGRIGEPYGSGYLPRIQGADAFVEMTRGCPWRCSYCAYSRGAPEVREQPFRILERAVERAESDGVKCLYLMSPSFNACPEFHLRLKKLASMNHGVSLHTEMRTHSITRPDAVLLRDAGFASLEVGLQTLTEEALVKAGRRSNTGDEIKGMLNLKKEGISLKIGIIPGLPGDSPENFKRTVDILAEHSLAEDVEAYPLMVLPGTRMRDEALGSGMRFMEKPPYYFTGSSSFSDESIRELREYIESVSAMTSYNWVLPSFMREESGIPGGIILNGSRPFEDSALEKNIPETHAVSVYLEEFASYDVIPALKKIIHAYDLDDNILSVIIRSEDVLNEQDAADAVKDHDRDCFYRRLHYFHLHSRSERIGVFQLFTDSGNYLKAAERYGFIEPLLVCTEINAEILFSGEWMFFPKIVVPYGMYETLRKKISAYYEFPDYIEFESAGDKKLFCADAGIEYVKALLDIRHVKIN